ncbi:MAG TPA: GDP-mannose 4,6-dehydratase, partial [Candidatus Acidoferrales bacterium]|nr:GDP-mannose 4,6-dehydratase [Candidatus Acidoferrales bacterium]
AGEYVEVDPAYVRPTDVGELRGDASKASKKLGWRPSTTFEEMIREMLEHDLQAVGLNPEVHLKRQPVV